LCLTHVLDFNGSASDRIAHGLYPIGPFFSDADLLKHTHSLCTFNGVSFHGYMFLMQCHYYSDRLLAKRSKPYHLIVKHEALVGFRGGEIRAGTWS